MDLDTNKNYSGLKNNLKQNNNNSPDNKNKEFNYHIKSHTLNINNNKSEKNSNSNKESTNILNSNSKTTLTTNPELDENPNLENMYRKLLMLAKRGDREKFLEIYRQILSIQKNINVNYKDENGYTALHYACDEGNLKIVEIILDADCDTNIKNINKQTPLYLSAKRGYFDISKKLIESGAEINLEDSEKNSPLHYICKNNYIELLKYFLTKNPKVDVKNIYGKTPKDLTTNLEIKNLLDEFKNNNKKNETDDLIDKKIRVKNDINSKNNKINKKHTSDTSKEKFKTEAEQKNKKHLNKNEFINNSMNIQIVDNHLDNSLNISNNKENRNIKLLEKDILQDNKQKNDQNIIIQSTNNINNNNININIYSIEEMKRPRANTNLTHIRGKNKYKLNEYLITDESHHNANNSVINRTSTSINSQFNKKLQSKTKNVSKSKNKKKSKFYQDNIKSIFDSIESSDKNIFDLNKTEENINKKESTLNKNKNLNNSVNILRTNINKNYSNNHKLIQSTEHILSKTKHHNKKQSKFKPSNNIDNSININSSKIAISKTHKIINELDIINRSNIIPSKTKKKLSQEEHITPSNFICLAQLGKGSFGEVYLVQKINTSEKYAMKVLRKERIIGQNLLKYALAEKNVLSDSNHPFIVKLKYAFQTSTKLFLVLEYCPNGDLSKHLSFEKRFKEPRAKFYICEVLLALENLHKRDVIFRDLKPDNVVLDNEGHCKLTDFGLSKEGVTENAFAQSFCGSIAYLAPEMLTKQGHGKAVDWYLLGVLFYEMLVGITPYFTTRKEDIFYNIEYGELRIPNFVSKEAAELLKRLLERNPNKRLGGCGRDAEEIKEHPYFKDVDWKKVYEKKIKPPNFIDYMKNSIKYYNKPKLFANDDFLNKTDEHNMPNMLKGWSFINQD